MADSSFDKAKDEFEKMQQNAAKMLDLQKQLEKGISGYAVALKDIYKTEQDILHTKQKRAQAEKDLADYEKSIADKRARWLALTKSKNAETAKLAAERVAKLEEEVNIRKANVKLLGLEVDKQEKHVETLKKAVKESNKLKSIASSTGNFVKKWGFDKLKEYGVFEMDKEIRNAARSMGVGNKQFKSFSRNLERAGDTTINMGVSTKQLAKLQQGYSEEIGRSVQLSKEGLVAMAGMAEGTGLGEQFAIGMAGAMDTFGGSVENSAKLVEETMNMAGDMGVNSAKAAKSLQSNLKLAQKYNFKGGVKGLARMSTEALKLKLDLDGIAGLADKVFRPEGAVEMAAKLQTMGGAFAQMADPMQLMFKARNDFEGFAKDIGKATSEFVAFNEKTGTFDIKGGLAADRMREIANMTGLGVDKLQEMAVAQKRIETIGAITPISFSKEDDELIGTMAKMSEDGEWKVNVGGVDKEVSKLQKSDLERLRKEKATLEERAKQSRTAMEDLNDIKESFQQLLIPVAQALKTNFAEPLKKLLGDEEFKNSLREFAETAADLVGGLAKFIIENPGKAIAAALTTWAGSKIFKGLTWIANGRLLGMGFNSVASAGGGGGGGGISDLLDFIPGRKGAKFKAGRKAIKKYGSAKAARAARGSSKGMFSGLGKVSKFGKVAKLGGALSIASAGLDAFNNFTDDDLSAGDAFWKTLDQNKFTAIGAALAPFTGGASLAIGGALDAIVPTIGNYNAKGSQGNVEGWVNDGIIRFNPKDKFMMVNDGVMAASTSEGQLDKLVNNEVHHTFDDIKISVTIDANGIDKDMANQLIDDKTFIRSLNVKLKEEAAMAISGGILNPNPKTYA